MKLVVDEHYGSTQWGLYFQSKDYSFHLKLEALYDRGCCRVFLKVNILHKKLHINSDYD